MTFSSASVTRPSPSITPTSPRNQPGPVDTLLMFSSRAETFGNSKVTSRLIYSGLWKISSSSLQEHSSVCCFLSPGDERRSTHPSASEGPFAKAAFRGLAGVQTFGQRKKINGLMGNSRKKEGLICVGGENGAELQPLTGTGSCCCCTHTHTHTHCNQTPPTMTWSGVNPPTNR